MKDASTTNHLFMSFQHNTRGPELINCRPCLLGLRGHGQRRSPTGGGFTAFLPLERIVSVVICIAEADAISFTKKDDCILVRKVFALTWRQVSVIADFGLRQGNHRRSDLRYADDRCCRKEQSNRAAQASANSLTLPEYTPATQPDCGPAYETPRLKSLASKHPAKAMRSYSQITTRSGISGIR